MGTYIKIAATLLLLTCMGTYAFQLGSPFNTPLAQKHRKELESLVVPVNRLPLSCRLATEIKTAPVFPATTNPFITDNVQLIEFVSQIGFGNKQLQDVSTALSALYINREPQNEVGVWGLKFKTAGAAGAAHKSLKYKEVLRKDVLLVTLWRDADIGELCLQAIKDYLISNGFENLPARP